MWKVLVITMYGNKASILVNKVRGQVKSINLIKNAFREVVDKKDNVFQSQTKNNFLLNWRKTI